MKCFTIIEKGCIEGIDAKGLPITAALKNTLKDGKIINAAVVPIAEERDDISFEELFKQDLHRASAICKIVFDATDKVNNEAILIAYNPKEVFPSLEGGDSSDIVYRSKDRFIARCTKGNTVFRKIIQKTLDDKYQIVYNGDVPELVDIPTKITEITTCESSFTTRVE